MEFTVEQKNAINAVTKWYKTANTTGKQVFRLFGYAGTGKTTIAQEIARSLGGSVKYAAFTGKAAQVMQSKGCKGASTIHSLIYTVEVKKNGDIEYHLDDNSPVLSSKLTIVDECSMVGDTLAADLLSFGKPILVLGDPAQLPPVDDPGFFINESPDILLTEIHRQARDNPIISLSIDAREHRRITETTAGDCRVLHKDDFDILELLEADQIMCGKNSTRTQINSAMRELKDIKAKHPITGERLVCLKNNARRGLLNGSLWEVVEVLKRYAQTTKLTVRSVDDPSIVIPVYMHDYSFSNEMDKLDWRERGRYDEFDFGYCITVHKAQGSEWDHVVIFDESGVFRNDKHKWLYTAITRASKRLTMILD